MNKRALYLFLGVWVLVSPIYGQSPPWNRIGEPIRHAAERERAAHDAPSIALAVIDRTGLVWFGSVGRVKDAHSSPPDTQTLYRVVPATGMRNGAARATPEVLANLARAEIAPIDASRFTASALDGDRDAGSAGALYVSADDIAQFAAALLKRGTRTTGFIQSTLEGHRRAGHDGSVYGYSSELDIFPDDGFAVFVASALGDAEHGTQHLAEFVARTVIAARANQPAPAYAMSEALPTDLAHGLQGHYVRDAHIANAVDSAAHGVGAATLDARVVDGKLFIDAPGVVGELRRLGAAWVIDDLGVYRTDVNADVADGTIKLGAHTYRRATWNRPAPPPGDFAGLIGDYGTEHYYIRVYERDGQPYIREGFTAHERLKRMSPDVYAIADKNGANAREPIHFIRDRNGSGLTLNLDGHVFGRRDFGAEADAQVRANALHTKDLRKQALAATPPAESAPSRKPDLVELVRLDPGIHLDIRYATKNNFMGMQMYETPRAFLQRDAAEATVRAHRALATRGFGILVHDAYRPWYVTKMFWDATPHSGKDYVADPAKGSRHNRGCAADVTLYDLTTGKAVDMPGRYDETSARSSPLYVGGTSLERWHRDLLKSAMEAQGFAVYTYEWWHFDYAGWEQYPIMNVEFDRVAPAPRE